MNGMWEVILILNKEREEVQEMQSTWQFPCHMALNYTILADMLVKNKSKNITERWTKLSYKFIKPTTKAIFYQLKTKILSG